MSQTGSAAPVAVFHACEIQEAQGKLPACVLLSDCTAPFLAREGRQGFHLGGFKKKKKNPNRTPWSKTSQGNEALLLPSQRHGFHRQ